MATTDPAPPAPETLKSRRDFLACARARRWAARGLVLQARDRGDCAPLRTGYTCSKKLGNAVARNRAKRRLRAAARATIPRLGRTGWDYVLIGRAGETARCPFALLLADLAEALARVHAPRRGRQP